MSRPRGKSRSRWYWLAGAGAGIILAPTVFYALDPFAGPRFGGPPSDHFDGETFRNLAPGEAHGFSDLIRWARTRDPGYWPEWIDARPGPPPPPEVSGLRITLIGHSSVLVQADRLNILTDPQWSERASPVSWTGPRRHRAPGIRFEDLPRIHYVLVSHNHYDHLDLHTLKRLAAAHKPRFITSLGNGPLLARAGVPNVTELDWWQTADTDCGRRIMSVPAQHFSGRGFRDRNRTLWSGFLIETSAGPVYFAGDTAMGPHFDEIRRRLGPPRSALLPVGAFRPRWFMAPVHLSPEEAVRAHQLLGASTSIAIHYGTFALGDDGAEEPIDALRRALKQSGNPGPQFLVIPFGEGREL